MKSRKKLPSAILPKGSTLLDYLTNDINGSSFEPLLNMVNRVVANMNLANIASCKSLCISSFN